MCPSKRPLAGIARSRFTRSPGFRSPIVVWRSVSAITSEVNWVAVNSVTVKHTPSTEMETPNAASSNALLASIVMSAASVVCLISVTVPISVMIPVNIFILLVVVQIGDLPGSGHGGGQRLRAWRKNLQQIGGKFE